MFPFASNGTSWRSTPGAIASALSLVVAAVGAAFAGVAWTRSDFSDPGEEITRGLVDFSYRP